MNKEIKLIQFKTNNQLLFTVKETELDLAKMNLKYLGSEEYNFVSGITNLTFKEIKPLKTVELWKDSKKIKELLIANAKPVIDFECFHCEENKQQSPLLVNIDGLGVDPHKLVKICVDCADKVNIINRPKYEF